MNEPSRNALISAVQGGPAGIIIAMLAYPNRSHGETKLAAMTGRDPKSVRQSLRHLQALGLVQRHSRYNGWAPTSYCRQLVLPAPNATGAAGPLATRDREILPLPPGSSSDPPGENPTNPYRSTTTTTPDREILPVPAHWSKVHQTLTETCAATPKAAITAITAAIQRHEQPNTVLIFALTWLSYCLSQHGTGINNTGAFITSRIETGTPPPAWHKPDLEGEAGALLRRLRYRELAIDT